MPAISKASSTPLAALAVPMAPMLGVHVFASTLAAETVCAGGCMVAKNWVIILSRKKLNQIRPAQSPTAGRTREQQQCAVSWLFPRFQTQINGFL